MSGSVIETLRCLRDHPRHPASDTLLAPPVADPAEAAAWSRICVDGVTLLASIGDLDRAEKVYADLVAVSEGEHATGEILLHRAKAGVNFAIGLALCGKRNRARTLLRESLDHFTSCNEIKLARITRKLLAELDQN